MNPARESLGDFVRRIRREKNLSLTDVSRRSLRFGEPIAASYINRLENEPKRRVTAEKLEALANGLGIPAEELFARAVGVVRTGDTSNEIELLTRFRQLSPECKADVLRFVDLWYQKDRLPENRLS